MLPMIKEAKTLPSDYKTTLCETYIKTGKCLSGKSENCFCDIHLTTQQAYGPLQTIQRYLESGQY